jgi:hypothetical protein
MDPAIQEFNFKKLFFNNTYSLFIKHRRNALHFTNFLYYTRPLHMFRFIQKPSSEGFSKLHIFTLISGFRRYVDKICGLLGYYTASCGICLPTFRDNVSVPSSRVKIPSRKETLSSFFVTGFLSFLESWPVKMGPIRCLETSVNNYHTTPCNNP